ncbi:MULTISPECIES: stage III sporulation protein SpoIIIAB [Clostridium]|uniref:Stage III sporulation protein AB n=1 Tax=Clostridium cibarium TaxID=2762247 RepID=A0ABR8PPD8_9CLOT|nr:MULTISPECIES: stage III sporulation protein SpoIIIAB [Clostridium]MBD7910021.1 stage III sporulation protein AB [Clostridium cibarium]
MFKIMLIIVILIFCTSVGYIYGESFRKRYVILKESYKCITILQNEVVFNNTPLPEAFMDVASKTKEPMNVLLNRVSEKLSKGTECDVYSAFKSEFTSLENDFFFAREDKSVLEDFVRSLGESGVYGQEKIFKLSLENLKINIEEAYELGKKNTKLYRYLGICIGVMISILLL